MCYKIEYIDRKYMDTIIGGGKKGGAMELPSWT